MVKGTAERGNHVMKAGMEHHLGMTEDPRERSGWKVMGKGREEWGGQARS